jgi:hypothetical protein
MSKKYLYGASIQGIQSFIFKTNKLAEIVGASEIVEHICTKLFYETVGISNIEEGNIILSAAGNIKFIFDDQIKCSDFIRIFPKVVMDFAPGITLSQAVVVYEGGNLSKHIDSLELKLKAQRNKMVAPTEIAFMGLERDRRTAEVAFAIRKTPKGNVEAVCEATINKRKLVNIEKEDIDKESQESLFKKISGLNVKNREMCFNIEDMTKGNNNSWIAVIHADGNGIGNILQNLGAKLNEAEEAKSKKAYRTFSKALENATKNAAQKAFEMVVKENLTQENRFPIRPVLCGGDDLTVIIRADLALAYTESFLREFEIQTKNEFKVLEEFGITEFREGITACAGISYVKESYPLHYALHLAESLCADAKKKVKSATLRTNGIPESSLAFYKVQESFVENLDILKMRTLKTDSGLDFYKGPYTLDEVLSLNKDLTIIKEESDKNEKTKAVGKLRQIVSESYIDKSTTSFMLNRMAEINSDFYKKLNLDAELAAIEEDGKSKLLDLITLHSFNYGNRNN